MINRLINLNVYDLDLQCVREANHNNNLYHKNRPKLVPENDQQL